MAGPASSRGVLALRFDIDSIRCLEEGVPRLMELGDRRGCRFTFFINMGRSFSWRYNVTRALRQRLVRTAQQPEARADAAKMSVASKLGWGGVLRTVAMNPRLGRRYRYILDRLHGDGHELGLHGGSNHAAWQYGLEQLGKTGLERLFRVEFDAFKSRYGQPAGFASPGFQYNDSVLALLDQEGFSYGSDMAGELPFRPRRSDGDLCRHFQVPVNVVGRATVPVIEEGLARSQSVERIVGNAVEMIRARRFALMYGHPFVEGVHWRMLDAVLEEVTPDYDVVTVSEYLARWKESSDA